MVSIDWYITSIQNAASGKNEYFVKAEDVLETICSEKYSDREKLAILQYFLAELACIRLEQEKEVCQILLDLV